MAEMEKSDEELMNEYAANDDSRSFELLYHRYAGKVFGYLMNRIRDQAQCEEIHQNVFLKLHQVREQYRNDLPFAPWLFTIVRSVMIDSIRKSKTHSSKFQEIEKEELENIAEHIPSGADQQPSSQPDLKEMKKKLSRQERTEIELRYEKDWTFEKIARELGLTEAGVRKRISRAIQKMRKSR